MPSMRSRSSSGSASGSSCTLASGSITSSDEGAATASAGGAGLDEGASGGGSDSAVNSGKDSSNAGAGASFSTGDSGDADDSSYQLRRPSPPHMSQPTKSPSRKAAAIISTDCPTNHATAITSCMSPAQEHATSHPDSRWLVGCK